MLTVKLTAQGDDAWQFLAHVASHRRARIAFISATINKTATVKGDITMLLLTDTQECDLAIQPLTAKGKPAQIDGIPIWTTSDATIARITPSTDGLSAVVAADANLGSAQITVSADADLGEGVETLTGVLDVEIAAGKAVTLGIIAGTPREQA